MTRGIVAAGDSQTAEAGAAIFRLGGNAVDAAVAAAFASFVAEISVVNIGAAGFAMVFDPNAGPGPAQRATAYDFCAAVPSLRPAAERDFREVLIDFGGDKQPFFIGRASTAVPGAVAGLCAMALERGSLPLATLLKPAIALSRSGTVVSPIQAYVFDLLQPIFSDTPEMKRIIAPEGHLARPGEVLRFSHLAKTWERLSREGPDLFYRGALAEAIADDHARNGGLITLGDLGAYRVEESLPVRIGYRGYEVLLPGPSSHGGVLIGFALKLLETVDLGDCRHSGYGHLLKLAHALRLTSLARKDWDQAWELASEPPDRLIARFLGEAHVESYAARLKDAVGRERHENPSWDVDTSPGHTTHISAVDEHGMAVSITTSAGEGAGYEIADTGMTMNNMLGEHDLNPHGFHRDPAGTRLRSMMSPAIVVKDGTPLLALGSAGSNRLRSAIVQTISNVIDFGMRPNQAVNEPRIHFEAGVLHLEGGIPGEVAAALDAAGFSVNPWQRKSLYFGGAQAVMYGEEALVGGADERRGGAVASVS